MRHAHLSLSLHMLMDLSLGGCSSFIDHFIQQPKACENGRQEGKKGGGSTREGDEKGVCDEVESGLPGQPT